MIEAYKEYWAKYANFSGRTTVSGYWYAFLCNIIASAVIGAAASFVFPPLAAAWTAANLVPGLAITVRRLNDCGRSWTTIFLGLIPLVGWILMIVRLCEPSQGNQYNGYTPGGYTPGGYTPGGYTPGAGAPPQGGFNPGADAQGDYNPGAGAPPQGGFNPGAGAQGGFIPGSYGTDRNDSDSGTVNMWGNNNP